MASKMIFGLASILLAPTLVTATSFEYYRSVFCDVQSPDFFLEKYTSPVSITNDKLCHQTPARTMAMKMVDGLDSACVVLAYEDYACENLIGSVPSSGKCVAATKAKIGSWQAVCNSTSGTSADNSTPSFVSGELKRRGKLRLPKERDNHNATTSGPSTTTICTLNNVATASSIVSEISSAISASANSTEAQATSSPFAGAALSSAISSGAGVHYNLTAYATDGANSISPTAAASANVSTIHPSMTTTTTPTTVSSSSAKSNSTANLHLGAASSNFKTSNGNIMWTVLTGLSAVLGTALLL